ncbi:nickel pincer cofactor biosynthesis protein LarB [Martelella alba]|uniref:Nickel pincer cofactor biosynthesis protein LarB n=1 Tax=Martelella alba TaxID=2590451 RepID=A0ABY2SFG6_9HYPH|nr:nickel pincer cofactor biosynthesis protein LarB [Martelella alba]TKI03054.1 nickel pincer cofactor biosynthesis protein LarB [Martelella alba]
MNGNREFNLDVDRLQRCGVEEAVLCEYKSVEQLIDILSLFYQKQKRVLLTRLDQHKFTGIPENLRTHLIYNPVCHCAIFGKIPEIPDSKPAIAIVSGGTSDAKVCYEVQMTLHYHGIACTLYQDVGVAGLWRLQQCLSELAEYKIIIAVAGMEAALPTVLAGLLDTPIIAVPTSIGYGVSAGGKAALSSCLSSCAGGLLTVNIDNGFGAASAAIKIYRKLNI